MGLLCQVVGSPSNGRESDPQNTSLSSSHVPPPYSTLTHSRGNVFQQERMPLPQGVLVLGCHLIKLQAAEATECGVTDFILQMGLRRDASQTSPCSHRAWTGEKRVAYVRSSPSITPALLHSAFCMRYERQHRKHPFIALLGVRWQLTCFSLREDTLPFRFSLLEGRLTPQPGVMALWELRWIN